MKARLRWLPACVLIVGFFTNCGEPRRIDDAGLLDGSTDGLALDMGVMDATDATDSAATDAADAATDNDGSSDAPTNAVVWVGAQGPTGPAPPRSFRLALASMSESAEHGTGLALLPEDDLLVTGDSGEIGGTIARIAPNGYVRWIVGLNVLRFWQPAVSADGRATVVGWGRDSDLYNATVVRVTEVGQIQWAKTYRDDNVWGMTCSSITSLKDGGVCLGCQSTNASNVIQPVALKLDTDGNVAWSKRLTLPVSGRVVASLSPEGDTCVLLGHTRFFGGGVSDGFLAKFSGAGDFEWLKQLAGDPGESVTAAAGTVMKGQLVIVLEAPRDLGGTDSIFARLDADGTIRWSERLHNLDAASGLVAAPRAITARGDDIFACSADSILKLGPEGTLKAGLKRDGIRNEDSCWGIAVTAGGFLAAATTSNRLLSDPSRPNVPKRGLRQDVLQVRESLESVCDMGAPEFSSMSSNLAATVVDVPVESAMVRASPSALMSTNLSWAGYYGCL